MKLTLIIFCLWCTLLTSCATLINGPLETISVSSTPSDAEVSDGKETHTTPTQFALDRNRDYLLTITKAGYKPETVKITHVVSGWVAGNLISFGMLGACVDAATGSVWRLEPDTIIVTLHPIDQNWFQKWWQKESTKNSLETLDEYKQKDLITDKEYHAVKKVIQFDGEN